MREKEDDDENRKIDGEERGHHIDRNCNSDIEWRDGGGDVLAL